MPKPVRSQKIWTLTKRIGDTEDTVYASITFKSIYQLALFELKMSKPSLSERKARITYNKTGACFLWDSDKFETFEEALWSPIGEIARIDKVPLKK